MVSLFIVLVIFASVTQSTFAFVSPTYHEVPSDMLGGYSILHGSEEMTYLYGQKALNLIFSCFQDMAKVALGYQNLTTNCKTSGGTFKSEVESAFLGQYVSTILVIPTFKSDAYSEMTSSWNSEARIIKKCVDYIVDAMDLASGKNAYENIEKLESLESKSISEFQSSREYIYSQLSDRGNTMPEAQTAIENAQNEGKEQLKTAVRAIFVGLKVIRVTTISKSGSNATSTYSRIDNAWKQASKAFGTEIRVLFSACKRIYLSYSILKKGIQANLPLIQAINMVAMSDYEKAMSSLPTIAEDGSYNITIKNENGTLTNYTSYQSCY